MAAVDDVINEVFGKPSGHVVALWTNVKEWAATSKPRTLQDKVTRIARELLEQATYEYDEGRDAEKRAPLGIRNAVFRVLREATMWLPRRSKAELDAKKNRKDTVLGHAVDAASYGQLNHELLVAINAKLDRLLDK